MFKYASYVLTFSQLAVNIPSTYWPIDTMPHNAGMCMGCLYQCSTTISSESTGTSKTLSIMLILVISPHD